MSTNEIPCLTSKKQEIQLIIKNIKKTVDNSKWEWYHNQAVSGNNAKQHRFHWIRKKFENKCKKLLTNFFWFDKMDKLLQTSSNEL